MKAKIFIKNKPEIVYDYNEKVRTTNGIKRIKDLNIFKDEIIIDDNRHMISGILKAKEFYR